MEKYLLMVRCLLSSIPMIRMNDTNEYIVSDSVLSITGVSWYGYPVCMMSVWSCDGMQWVDQWGWVDKG